MSCTLKLLSWGILPFWSWDVRKRSQEDKALCVEHLWTRARQMGSCLPWHWHVSVMRMFVSFSCHILVWNLINQCKITAIVNQQVFSCLSSSCPPFHAVDLHLVSFPIFSYCDFSVSFHSPWMSQSRRSEVQTGFLLSAYNFALTVTSSRCMPFHSEK